MYTINPMVENTLRDATGFGGGTLENRDSQGEMSLRYMAQQSGGKYFAGRDIKQIIKDIRKTTSAYYEIAFHVPPDAGERYKIQFKCKRKGIKVHTLSHSERNKPYSRMTGVQKKVFAMDTISGGSWSRMVAKIVKGHFKLKKEKGKYLLDAKLPKSMQNLELDVFTIQAGKEGEDTHLDFKKIKVKDSLMMTVKPVKKKKGYMVVIDPKDTRCFYGKLR